MPNPETFWEAIQNDLSGSNVAAVRRGKNCFLFGGFRGPTNSQSQPQKVKTNSSFSEISNNHKFLQLFRRNSGRPEKHENLSNCRSDTERLVRVKCLDSVQRAVELVAAGGGPPQLPWMMASSSSGVFVVTVSSLLSRYHVHGMILIPEYELSLATFYHKQGAPPLRPPLRCPLKRVLLPKTASVPAPVPVPFRFRFQFQAPVPGSGSRFPVPGSRFPAPVPGSANSLGFLSNSF